MKRAAAIDVGSGSVKLYVGERTEKGTFAFRDVLNKNAMTRLGEGLRETGSLSDAAIARTARAVAAFAQEAREAGAERIACVGTMALREAANAAEFVCAVHAECGLQCCVLPGEEEARLCFAASCGREETLSVDSGGGSTELAYGREGVPLRRASLPIGAINVTERFLAADASEKHVHKARAFIRKQLEESGMALPAGARLVATGGTATTMAAVMTALAPYDPEKIRGVCVPAEEAERQVTLYAALPVAERAKLTGMHAGREDVILGGVCILAETMAFFGASGITVSDRGLRHGVVRAILIKDEQFLLNGQDSLLK